MHHVHAHAWHIRVLLCAPGPARPHACPRPSAPPIAHPAVAQYYVRRNQWTYWLGWGLALALILVLACVEKARRTFPANMILLGAFTIVQAYLVG